MQVINLRSLLSKHSLEHIMSYKSFASLIIVCCLLLPGCTKEKGSETPRASVAREGIQAPDFSLKDLSGTEVRLSSLRGKVVFLNFWATWCPPCREEIPSMMRLNQTMSGKPFQMLAVSIDDGGRKAVTEFFSRTGFNLPALNDTDQSVGKMFGITGVPETFVIDKKGVILKKVVGGMDWNSPESIDYFTKLAAQ
jgi:peroxiredoxin